MKRTTFSFLSFTLSLLTLCLFFSSLEATIMHGYSDISPMHTVYGMNKNRRQNKKTRLQVTVAPYHQHAKTARNTERAEVPLGDYVGRINMAGVLTGFKNFTDNTYANDLYKLDDTAGTTVLHTAYKALKDGTDTDIYIDNATAKTPYSYDGNSDGFYSTALSYSRIGVRGAIEYSLDAGLGVIAKGGVAQYRVRPTLSANPGSTAGPVATALADNLLVASKRQAIEKELKIDMGEQDEAGIEDASVELYWRRPYTLKDKEGDVSVVILPHFGVSITIPVASARNTDKLFALSLGNNGFYGVTGNAEVAFDFPGMVRLGVGGSATFFEQKSGLERAPTSSHQSVLYPWKTTVTRRLGNQYKLYGTLHAKEFIDNFDVYIDYQYVINERDTISYSGTKKAFFLVDKLQDASYSDAQLLSFGIDYGVTEGLRFGIGFQSVLAGKHVWKTTTVIGSLSFVF